MKQLLAERPFPGKTLYEEWTNPHDGRSYCVGYIPIDYDGEISCYARIRYDWTDFLRGLNRSIAVTVLWAAVLLAVLNGILLLLIRSPGRVYSSSEIYEHVWRNRPIGADNTVSVHIRHLRQKLEYDPSNPRYLKVVWGLGYKLEGGDKR